MLIRAVIVVFALLVGVPAPAAAAVPDDSVPAPVASAPVDDRPAPTFNEFLPEDRGLGECISALPKPGCGSSARGGWHQGLVFAVIMTGLAFIAWRVVAASRRARRDVSW